MFIAGDIGGTKTLLGEYERDGAEWVCRREASFQSGHHPDFQTLLGVFMQDTAEVPEVLSLGVAGPVIEGCSEVTNLSWHLDERELARSTGIPKVRLLNDLQAMSLGLLRLSPERFVDLNPDGMERQGNRAVLAAGTGLGESILYWDGERHHAMATEGGHTDFAPNDEIEDRLLQYLRQRFGGHVSYERVLSGAGLVNIYEFLRDSGLVAESGQMAGQLSDTDDRARAISQAGLDGRDLLSRRALELFVRIYAAEAGNLVLQCFAIGGVLIGGGIAPKILPALTSGLFMQAFTAKGRFSELMRTIPVRVALDSNTGLLGAAVWAERYLKT